MDRHVQLIRLCLKFGLTMGTNIGFGHQYEVSADQNQGKGNGDVVPRHVVGVAKPIHRAGGHGQGDEQQDGDEDECFFHEVTAFLGLL